MFTVTVFIKQDLNGAQKKSSPQAINNRNI